MTELLNKEIFNKSRETIRTNYKEVNCWDPEGMPYDELRLGAENQHQSLQGQDKRIVQAEIFSYLLRNTQFYIDKYDLFVSKINCRGLLNRVCGSPYDSLNHPQISEIYIQEQQAWSIGAYRGGADYMHTVPDWNSIMSLGIPGLLKRIKDARYNLSGKFESERVFYISCEIVLQAVLDLLLRFSEQALQAAEKSDGQDAQRLSRIAQCLKNLAYNAPKTLHEAMQLSLLYYVLEEHVEGMRIRSLGGLDRLFNCFYCADINDKRLSKEQAIVLSLYYFNHFHMLDVIANMPFYFGGTLANGSCGLNELSYLLLDAFCELNSDNIKVHVRVTKDMPQDFLRRIYKEIRQGLSGFVLINDEIAMKSLIQAGIEQQYVHEFTPTGCYETTVMGEEVACTECSAINLLKAIELSIGNGTDLLTGIAFSPQTGENFINFEEFYNAVKKQIAYLIDKTLSAVRAAETFYPEFGIFPLFSSTFESCVKSGLDAYAGGCRYNNSGVDVAGIGSAADALYAIKNLIFETGRVSLSELREILKNNWIEHEILRRYALLKIPKWGNNDSRVDDLAIDLAKYTAHRINGQKNARGGVFKAALYSFDRYIWFGQHTAATPDGRKSGEPLSKNLCAASSMNKNSITAEILSVTKIDYSDFPNGSVLDILFHPSAVRGEDGVMAMADLVRTYFRLGGYAVQMNVFDRSTLVDAQRNPEKYTTLQIRVCGYNEHFINLDKALQDDFLDKAKDGEE
ncbi:MAG: pyruvate formate lyase family protein [Clostridiaceae bacterium]|nr:pyruvate formate lyase family protein [Clostridiaceae bacterium]